jgi:hypothetical protein
VPVGKLKEQIWEINFFFTSLQSLKKGVRSEVGSGAGAGSGSVRTKMSMIPNTACRYIFQSCALLTCGNVKQFLLCIISTYYKTCICY